MLPLQRYEDIFLGREAPCIPKEWPPNKENNMFTDAFLANLMSQSISMKPNLPPAPSTHLPPAATTHLPPAPIIASTPAPPSSAPHNQAPHFSFSDIPELPESSTSFTRPPNFLNNQPIYEQSTVEPRAVTPLEPRPQSHHSSVGSAPSPRPTVVSPSSIQPTFDIGEVPVTNRGRGGRGRGNRNRTAQTTGPTPVGATPGQDAAPPQQSKSQILKSNIKQSHPHLSDADISRYLVRVRQENKNLLKATPALILDRVNEMVEADNIRTGRVPRRSSSSNNNESDMCPICYEGYDSAATSRLGCGHLFHTHCVGKWMRENHTCPTCRSHQPPPSEFPPLGR